jgi:hypothetical protein
LVLRGAVEYGAARYGDGSHFPARWNHGPGAVHEGVRFGDPIHGHKAYPSRGHRFRPKGELANGRALQRSAREAAWPRRRREPVRRQSHTLERGALSSLRHWHEEEDEFVYVLSAELTLIDDNGERPLREGSVRLQHLYAGLLLASPFAPTHKPVMLAGCRQNGEISVRSQHDHKPAIPSVVRHYPPVTLAEL